MPRSAAFALAIKISYFIYITFEAALVVAFFFTPFSEIVVAWSVFSAAISVTLAIAFLYANTRFCNVLGKVVLNTQAVDNLDVGYDDPSDSDTIAAPFFHSPPRASAGILNPTAARPISTTHYDAQQKLHRITQVSIICTVCSCIKAAIEAFQCDFMIKQSDIIRPYWWLVTFLYFILSEILPGALVLLALRKPRTSVPVSYRIKNANETLQTTPESHGISPDERSDRGASMYSVDSHGSGWQGLSARIDDSELEETMLYT